MTSFIVQCEGCAHYYGGVSCDAYNKIPPAIMFSRVSHLTPQEGDGGITFQPIDGSEVVTKYNPNHDDKTGRFSASTMMGNTEVGDTGELFPIKVSQAEEALSRVGIIPSHEDIFMPDASSKQEVYKPVHPKDVKQFYIHNNKEWVAQLTMIDEEVQRMKDDLGLDLNNLPHPPKLVRLRPVGYDEGVLGATNKDVDGEGGDLLSFNTRITSDQRANDEKFTLKHDGAHYGVDSRLAAETGDYSGVTRFKNTVRHELGHVLTTPKIEGMFKKIATESQSGGVNYTNDKNVIGPKWMVENLSYYGATHAMEGIAELFSYVTSKAYKKGSMPPELEGLVHEMVAQTFKKRK